VSAQKPAPTAAEIQEAKDWLDDDDLLDEIATSGYDVTASVIRVILSALDAAEARAEAAEAETWRIRQLNEIAYPNCGICGGHGTVGGPPDDYRDCPGCLNRSARATAERERDEARAALKPFADYAPACRALQPDDVILEEDADGINAYELTAGAFFTAADVVAKEAPRG